MKTSSARNAFTAACIAVAALRRPAPRRSAADPAYPCKTLTLVSPYPPGGTTDILARMVAPGLATQLGNDRDRRQPGRREQQHRHRVPAPPSTA